MAADTGLYSEYWNLGDVPDGEYEIAARVVCYSGGRLSRPGLGITVSSFVTGLIDRVAPVPESYSPSTGIIADASVPISVAFSCLNALLENDEDNLETYLGYAEAYHRVHIWRTKNYFNWNI